MDVTFRTPDGTFNYRACAIILHEGRILAMHDGRSPYYYLPGGRVNVGETAEAAVLREVQEELGIDGRIVRPLWLNQAFFTEDVSRERYHEVCLYFLVDVTHTELMAWGDSFVRQEQKQSNAFQWLPIQRLKEEYFYPIFLKEGIFHLPDTLTLRTEVE